MDEILAHVIETTPETFERDVLLRSREVPVVVDFWASWCQPCRLLGPLLERLAQEYAGQFVLVKADTEAMPQLAAAFGVRSIPAVFAVKDGQVVDSFVGLLPENALREFLDGLLPTPAEQALTSARALAETDPAGAEAALRAVLDQFPQDAGLRIALAELLRDQNRLTEAGAELEALERRGYLEPAAERLKAELTLRAGGAAAGAVEPARAALAAEPGRLDLAFALAEALAAAGQHAEALEICLDLVERDRRGVGEDARKLMLALFNILPADSPLVLDFRRRLSLVL